MSSPTDLKVVGPFRHSIYKLVLDGYLVPGMEAWPNNPQGTLWTVLVDGRLGYETEEGYLNTLVSAMADCYAIGCGYHSYRDACEHFGDRHNPFGSRMVELGQAEVEKMNQEEP